MDVGQKVIRFRAGTCHGPNGPVAFILPSKRQHRHLENCCHDLKGLSQTGINAVRNHGCLAKSPEALQLMFRHKPRHVLLSNGICVKVALTIKNRERLLEKYKPSDMLRESGLVRLACVNEAQQVFFLNGFPSSLHVCRTSSTKIFFRGSL
eukprot:Lithocolla_globosa_v1_NODE_6823_length_1030_cov_13.681026.p1 type:complete len:151 gc:universal NODE_6823_length_1030_cov_13.681026:763-311(-)